MFLTLLGLPLDELPRFLAMKDGIIRPDQVTGTDYGSEEMHALPARDRGLDLRVLRRACSTSARPNGATTCSSHFLDAEVDGEQLTRTEILDICFLFLIAGLDTVTATLDCMFAYLAQHPEHRRQLVDDPALIPAAVEELLRWETPVMGVARVAARDTELGGCPIHQGDQVMVMLGAANTDDAEFDDAGDGPLRPGGEPPPRVRRRDPPLPRLAPRPPGAADRAARVAPAHPRVRGRRRSHAGVHVGHPLDRALPDDPGVGMEPIKIGWLGSALDGPDGGYDRIHRLAFDEAVEQGLLDRPVEFVLHPENGLPQRLGEERDRRLPVPRRRGVHRRRRRVQLRQRDHRRSARQRAAGAADQLVRNRAAPGRLLLPARQRRLRRRRRARRRRG